MRSRDLIFICAATLSALAQTAPTGDHFGVAAIHPVDSKSLPTPVIPCSGAVEMAANRVTVRAATVFRLLAAAYAISCPVATNLGLISGEPDWARKELFSLEATVPEGTPVYSFQQLLNGEAPRVQEMLRNLLNERFHLAVHLTPKDTPIFNIYFMKEGKIRPSADQTTPGQAPNPIASPLLVGNDPANGIVRVAGKGVPLRTLIMAGQLRENRMVVDKTGLTGLYDVEPSVIDVGPTQAGFSSWPMMMSYLGFRLESTHGPVDAIVVDRLEKPGEN